MSLVSRKALWRSLPFVATVAIVAGAGGYATLPSHSAALPASAHPALAAGAIDPDSAAHAVRSAGNAFTKGPEGPLLSAEQEAYAIRAFPATKIPDNGYPDAIYQYNLLNNSGRSDNWVERGPTYTPNSDFFAETLNARRNTVSGRATAFVVDPRTCSAENCQTQYLGTANGGIWKSTNGGQSWAEIFDTQVQISIGGLTLDPVNPNIIYVGTGEGNNSADSNHGFGIYRSLDAGRTFVLMGARDKTDDIPNVFVNRSVTRIVVDPRTSKGAGTDHATLYVGTTTGTNGCNFTYDTCGYAPGRPPLGFYYTTNGGQDWTLANPPGVSQRINDLMMDPSNPNVLYLGVAEFGLYRTTTDALPSSSGTGAWTRLLNQPAPGDFYRITFDFAKSTANQPHQTIYAAYNRPLDPSTGLPDCNLIKNPACGVGGPEQLYRVTITKPQAADGGATYKALPNPNACDGQCWYDMPLRVDPTNAQILYAGGSANYAFYFGGQCLPLYPLSTACNAALMKSTDGGQTWRDISLDSNNVAIHPDDHYIFINPASPSTVWTQNDGGNYRATGANGANSSGNGGVVRTWSDENPGINAFQFQGIGVAPNGNVIGGTQDNGTFLTHPGSKTGQHILLGDGGQGVADPFNSSRYYSEQYGATMFRFDNPTCDFQRGTFPGGYPACGQTWIAPFAIDFFDYGGGSFYEPQTTAKYNTNGSQASNNIFHGTFRLWRSEDSGGVDVNHDGDATNDPAEQLAKPSYWVPISGDLSCSATDTSSKPSCGGNIVSITVAPHDPNTVVVSTSHGQLYITHNALAPVVTNQGKNYCPPTTFDPNVGDYVATCGYKSGVTWTEIDNTLPGRVTTEVAFAPDSTNHFYACLSGFNINTPGHGGHVFDTTNGGVTWRKVDGNESGYTLPDLPYNSIQVNQRNGHLYVAGDIGVFETVGDGINWLRIDYQLPNAPVYQLRLSTTSTSLFAALHGRGIWQGGAN